MTQRLFVDQPTSFKSKSCSSFFHIMLMFPQCFPIRSLCSLFSQWLIIQNSAHFFVPYVFLFFMPPIFHIVHKYVSFYLLSISHRYMFPSESLAIWHTILIHVRQSWSFPGSQSGRRRRGRCRGGKEWDFTMKNGEKVRLIRLNHIKHHCRFDLIGFDWIG